DLERGAWSLSNAESGTQHAARKTPPIPGLSIMDVCALSVERADEFFAGLKLTEFQEKIAGEVIKEIRSRLGFLKNVGLGYLTLNRESGTLSGGEAQRIRLATQIGAGLVGVLYILDEPSICLHQLDKDWFLPTHKQSQERRCANSAWHIDLRYRRERIGQKHARGRHFAARALPPLVWFQGTARRASRDQWQRFARPRDCHRPNADWPHAAEQPGDLQR